ncbi:MAG: NAD(P)-dependent oxidoreductase [Deltaproteobacteria bacterium]|nr:MAG: NAD(P)-dependent oxidoreductase [Deltaproteobacteria bacterium]
MEVAFIGAGLMGRPICERILHAGHNLVVFNRTREKAEPLRSCGAEVAGSPEEAIGSGECVILMLTDAAAIHEVLLQRITTGALERRTVIQMGTIAPAESKRLGEEVLGRGGDYLEAPVLGSIPEAEKGNLLVMVGGSQKQFERWVDLLRCLGPNPVLIAGVGKAAALKLALNQLVGALTASFALSLGFVQRQGVDVDLFMKILRQSALYAPTFDKKIERMLSQDYANPNFPSKHLLKDVDLFSDEARPLDLQLSVTEGVRQLFARTLEQGFAESDYSSIHEVINPGKTLE